jgi:DeoR/GlpR family transcriptional regulator of sugar metabolism
MSGLRLTKKERQDLILSEIQTRAAIRISDLAQRVGVSGETIRRDLGELGNAGLLNRTYGGATVSPLVLEAGISERGRTLVEQRARIGACAAGRVEPGEVVMIDGGSTTYQVARHLAQVGRNLTLITNSTQVASVAGANPKIRVVFCPGIYDPGEASVFGEDTLEFISRFTAHVAIFGASSVSAEGPYDAVSGSAAVKRAMLARCSRSMLVADASKFATSAFERICTFNRIAEIVTDQMPSADLQEELLQSGTRLIVAGI